MSSQTVKQLVVVSGSLTADQRKSKTTTPVVLLGPDGNVISTSAQTGADVVLTGYAPVAPADVVATDTVNAAIAKLEARIEVLEP